MRLSASWLRALRRGFLVFILIGLLPLLLIYAIRSDQLTKSTSFQDLDLNGFSDQSFRYPVMLHGRSKQLTIVAAEKTRKRFQKYAKYINESQRISIIPSRQLTSQEYQLAEQRIQNRRYHLNQVCMENKLDVVSNENKPNSWEYLVNKKYHLIWCNVFKAASSSWMYNFNILAGYSPQFLRKTKEIQFNLARERYPRVSLDELREAQQNATTFLIVRDPFERLLSAYQDKMVYAFPHSFHDNLGRAIVRKYRIKKKRDHPNTRYPSFSEFVRWLLNQIKSNSSIDMHFVSSNKFCTPCLIYPDVIMKFQTLQSDQLYLIEKNGLQHIIAPEWYNKGKGKNTNDLIEKSYGQLTYEELEALYNYYRYDFELFNYNASNYFKLVKPSAETDIATKPIV